ncbi:MAG: DNA repair protein RecN [Bacteroidales bacterium]|nr:DNA repair protein RecN [Candidatus Scybalousia scybalohippi]
MLQSLKIENYALIKECNISFSDGFSVITGETGAGKTILLGALSLVLGQRADTNVLMDKEKKCVVEAVFSATEDMKSLFQDNDIDYDSETIFRREILPSGKSRAFINDTPVQLSVVKLFSDRLVDIHSQSSTINLRDHSFQLNLLDSFIPDKNTIETYGKEYKEFKLLLKEIEDLKQKESEFLKDKSYNEFLYTELDEAKLNETEQEYLEQEVELMSNAEEIKEKIESSLFSFDNDGESGLLTNLKEVKNNIQQISSFNDTLKEIYTRVDSSLIELKDVYNELYSFNNTMEFDKNQLDEDNERLNLIYSLEKKHNVQTIKELLEIRLDLGQKLLETNTLSSKIEKKEQEKQQRFEELKKLALEVHKQRLAAAKEIEEKIIPLLSSMSMKDAILKIDLKSLEELSENGMDQVRFLFSANKTKSGELSDMGKVISGGELSRVMLALKSIIAERFALPTMLLDEIDTGISGDIASKAADIVKKIGDKHQVIVITHLVQMAAKADAHYKVHKQTDEEQTVSNISLLTQDQRLNEIATMISGNEVTKEALANAKILLGV